MVVSAESGDEQPLHLLDGIHSFLIEERFTTLLTDPGWDII